ncbi:acyltransferase [Nonomuraea sp. NBC_01738]|uniref:acyltransferase family protein n=1 Tax=Nonomuraea sp. NBC_01738 TaxID=2976003 RepID=UPI002E0DD9FA|nr:acyltransferase [Nonomuraea sp. NBC_01738]
MASGIEPPREAVRERRTELDAMRVLVVIGLVFFHASLVFDARADFYVKNAETTGLTFLVAPFCVVWAMPLLFLIAGLAARHSVRRRGPGGFAVERLLRLGVPLAFAMVAIVPIPPWLRLRTHPGYHASYLEFLPRFFHVRFDPGGFPFVVRGVFFETGHLWFVVLLFAFSLLLAPLVRWFPVEGSRLPALASTRAGLLLLGVPVAVAAAAAGLGEALGGWNRWAYLVFFLYGFLFAAEPEVRAAIRRQARFAAVAGFLVLAAGVPGFVMTSAADVFTGLTPAAIGVRALYGMAAWCLLVALVGLLDRPRAPGAATDRAVPRPAAHLAAHLTAYLAPAALPLYILHQPIVVGVAYLVVGWNVPMVVKYPVIVVLSLALTVAAYDLLVRRTRLTACLFGLRGPVARG